MNENINKHLGLLGHKVKDKVTGAKGIVTTVSFDLYGCVQGVIHQGIDKDKKPRDQHWYDVARLKVLSKSPVMESPNFNSGQVAEGKKGPAEKPLLKA